MRRAESGDTILFHYTGMLTDGQTFDSSTDRDPLQVTLGSGQVIRGVEEALTGMAAGDQKTVTVAAEKAYGAHRPELIQEIDRENLPPQVDVTIGSRLSGFDSRGRRLELTVVGLSDESVTLDANHPLAGQDLTFELELVSISGG